MKYNKQHQHDCQKLVFKLFVFGFEVTILLVLVMAEACSVMLVVMLTTYLDWVDSITLATGDSCDKL